MMSSIGKRLIVASAALLISFGAQAEIFSVCTVQKTKDGFAALRAAPSRDAPVVAKMRAEQIVVLDVRNGKFVRSGGWVSLSWFPGVEMPNPGDPGFDKVRRGWASWELVDECG